MKVFFLSNRLRGLFEKSVNTEVFSENCPRNCTAQKFTVYSLNTSVSGLYVWRLCGWSSAGHWEWLLFLLPSKNSVDQAVEKEPAWPYFFAVLKGQMDGMPKCIYSVSAACPPSWMGTFETLNQDQTIPAEDEINESRKLAYTLVNISYLPAWWLSDKYNEKYFAQLKKQTSSIIANSRSPYFPSRTESHSKADVL